MKNEWIPVTEDTPVIQPGYEVVTANVYVRFSDGSIGIGYFNYRDYLWYTDESRKCKKKVIEWKSL